MSKLFKQTPVAGEIPFDNSTNGFSSDNVQDAITESTKGGQFIQFQLIGQMNYNQYLFSGNHSYSNMDRRSGDASTGYQWGASSPITSHYSGIVADATISVRGVACSEGTPAATVTVKFELWKVGYSSEGTKLGDITFTINSGTYTIGAYWNSSITTGYGGNSSQSVSLTEGDLLALKFISTTGASYAVSIENTTVVLHLVES
jgi:hypothetical protein